MMNRLFSNVLQRLKPYNHGSNGSWESFAEPLILFDERLTVVKANQAARRLFSSYLVEDVVGKNLVDIMPDIKETGRYGEYLKVIKTGAPFFASDVVPPSMFGDVRLSVVAFKMGKGLGMMVSDTSRVGKIKAVLEESEVKYRTILETSLDGIYQVDTSGKLIFVNDAFADIFGYKTEELLGKQFSSLLDAETLVNVAGRVVEVFSGKNVKGEVPVIHKDGHKVMVDLSATPLRVRGKITGLTGMLRDVTERKQAEEALRESGERYKALVENAYDVINVIRRDGTIAYRSPASGYVPGLKIEDYVGMSGFDWVHPDDISKCMDAFAELMEKPGAVVHIELRTKYIDDSWHTAEANATNLLDNEAVQGIVVHWHDITERKRAEQTLQESEERFCNVLDNSLDMVYRLNLQTGTYDYVSPSTEKILGYSPEEFVAFTIEKGRSLTHPDDLARLDENVIELVTSKAGTASSIEYRIKHKELGYRWVSDSRSVVYDDGNNPVAVVGNLRDISEHKKAEEELRGSEANYRELADSIADVFFAMDENLRYIYWNKASEELTGIKARDVIGKHISEVFQDNDATRRAADTYRKALAERRPQTFVNEYNLGGKDYFFESCTYPSKRGISVFTRDISERKRAEDAIRESEERYRALVDTAGLAGEGIMIAERNTEGEAVIVFANGQLANILGYEKKEELIGMFGRSLFLPGDRIWLRDRHKRRRKGEELTNHYGVMAFRKDGSMVPIEVSMGAMKYQGKTATVVYVRDVSDRKKAEEALRETRDYLENLLNFASAPIVVWDPAFRITRFNRAFEHLAGYKAGEVIGKELRILFPQASRDKSLNEISRTLTGEHWESVEIPILRKNGETKLVLWNSSNVYAGDGVTLLATIAQGMDITERKQAQEILRESEERFRSLIENSSEVVLVLDKDGNITYESPSVERVLGYTLKEAVDRSGFDFIHPDDMPEVLRLYDRALRDTDSTIFAQVRVLHKDGSWHIVEALGRNLLDHHAVSGIVVNFRDVTERETAHRELVKHTRRVETLHAVAEAVSQTLELGELLDTALGKVLEVMNADAGCIYLLDVVEKELVLKTCKGVSEEIISQISTIKLGKKNMGKMLQWNGEIIAVQEIFGDTAMSLASESLNGAQIQSFAVAPFAVRGQFYGLIAVGNHSHCEISLADVDLLRAVGNQIGVGTQNAVLFEEVRALIRETMEAQEKERERVCLEVHDGVAQTLVSAFQFLQTMEATMPDDKQNKQLLAKATAQVRQAIQESREIINTLQPATLKDLGLVATLRQEMRNLGKETGLRIEFKSDDIRLPKDIETGLYRIIHEAVVNARKHAGCNHLRIRIHDVDGRLKVEVKDWGKGFDQASLDRARRRGTGLFSIHKRAEILKGTCDIHSKPGQGTTVNVEIPMSTVAVK